jgi:septum formation protein
MKKLILASNSPRRKELLEKAGLDFQIAKNVYKENFKGSNLIGSIKKISHCKAQEIANILNEDAIIIAADTIVILDSVCLVKPHDQHEAFFCLKNLSGKWHKVVSAITLIDVLPGRSLSRSLSTKVKFRNLEDWEIKKYIEEFNPLDKAGSYGIQDFVNQKTVKNPPKESFIEEIKGDYENVMGISTKLLLKMLDKIMLK